MERPPLSAYTRTATGTLPYVGSTPPKKKKSLSGLSEYSANLQRSQQVVDPIVESEGFFANVGRAFEERGKKISEAKGRAEAGQQTHAEGLLQTAGQVAGGAFDVVAEGVTSVAKKVLPQGVQDFFGGAAKNVAENPVVQQGVEGYRRWKEENPRAASDLEAVVNIGSLLPVGGAAKMAAKPVGSALKTTGKAVSASGEAAAQKELKSFAAKLVTPEDSKGELIDRVSRTTEKGVGPFKKSEVALTKQQAASAAEIEKLPINPRGTQQQAYNVIKDEVGKEDKFLEAEAKRLPGEFDKKELLERFKGADEALNAAPLIVGDAKKTAKKLMEGAKKFINSNEATNAGLLKAKKQFDAWVLSQKPKAFDASAENAFTTANREIRNVFKTFLVERVPGAAASLEKQHLLLNAMDDIAPKAAYEADSAIGRAVQKVGKALGTKNKIVQGVATVAGLGGLGAASFFAPVVAGVGVPAFVMWQAGKLVLRPGVRKAIGKILQQAGDVLSPTDRRVLEAAYLGKLDDAQFDSSSQLDELLESDEIAQATAKTQSMKPATGPNTATETQSPASAPIVNQTIDETIPQES